MAGQLCFWGAPEYDQYSRDVQIHLLITFSASLMLHEARATALDLDTTSGLLLNVLDIRPTLSYNLSTQVETGNGL